MKSKHPGVPADWSEIGSGGNAIVWFDGANAVKRLRAGSSNEAKDRFKREADIVSTLAGDETLSIVPVREVRTREGQLEIVMEVLDGNLDRVLDRFQGQTSKAAGALLPIARTLSALAARPRAIHHRDLKPSNILFRTDEDDLYLTDFGCAYLADDGRLTPDHRAMGAWAYRSPEYTTGKVEHVDEKGDVFSIAKVFWAMISGVPGFVFPGPVWFTPEFDLARIYPDAPFIHHSMLLIGKAASINPSDRPTLAEFSRSLEYIATMDMADKPAQKTVSLLQSQAILDIEFQQRRASTATFIRAMHADMARALENLHVGTPELDFWQRWHSAFQSGGDVEFLVDQAAQQESSVLMAADRYRKIEFHAHVHPPESASRPAYLDISVDANMHHPHRYSRMEIHNTASGLTFKLVRGAEVVQTGAYSTGHLETFLREATDIALNGPSEHVGERGFAN